MAKNPVVSAMTFAVTLIVSAVGSALLIPEPAAAQVATNATRTIFLARSDTASSPMNVAYHPGFARYYASDPGFPSRSAFVFDSAGALLQRQSPVSIEARAWNYNANTRQLEVVSYDAKHGGVGWGLILPGVTDGGALTGDTSVLLASLPGLANEQTMPAYDAVANVLYSRAYGSTVNVVSRLDGALVSTINLDLAAAGNPGLTAFALGYDAASQWLIVVSANPDNRAYVFELNGAYVGSSQLDIAVRVAYGMGYGNGQLFVNDDTRNGWQGYSIGNRPRPPNYQGLWWKSPAGSESGWGINFAHQGDIIFATWFTYGADNQPQWYTIRAQKTASYVYAGPVSSFTGPPFNSVPFPPNVNVKTSVGTATITLADDGKSATFTYTVNGITQSKQIVPQQFSPGVALPTCAWGAQPDLTLATNYQDLWWVTNGDESGWGINFTHQGNIIFATWFTYDANGKAWWLFSVAQETAVPRVYSGPVKTAAGPPFNADPFDPNAVTRTAVGNATITMIDGNHARFEYTVNGVTQAKNLTRQVFAPPGTVCQ